MSALRQYQIAARDAVYRDWADVRSVLLVMATGTGKTFTAGEILRARAAEGRILWLAHRGELLDQAIDTLSERIGLRCELEKAEHVALEHEHFGGAPVVVASVATMRGKRLERWDPAAFRTVVIDEAHHATARTYRAILERFADAKVLGLTATPDRGDGVGLGSVVDRVAYEYDLRSAISDGYLVPIVQERIDCADLDISDVKTVAGDLAQGELEERLALEAVLHQIAGPTVEKAGKRQTLIFCAGVKQAHALVDVLASYAPGRSAVIDGTTEERLRTERVAAYRAGEIQFLVNCGVFLEGFDAPATSCVAMARPTKSRSLYAQAIGRGSRTATGVIDGIDGAAERRAAIAASATPDLLVLDFVGNSGRHRLVSPLDVLAGRPLPPDIEARARELVEREVPSLDALAQAEAEAIERERAAEERRRRETKLRADVAYRATRVDPFGCTTGEQGPRASQPQLDFLRALKVDLKGYVPSKREASSLIDTIQKRRRAGLCTYAQAKLLASKGLSMDVPFAEARDLIDGIVANGWRATDEMRRRWPPVPTQSEMAERWGE